MCAEIIIDKLCATEVHEVYQLKDSVHQNIIGEIMR